VIFLKKPAPNASRQYPRRKRTEVYENIKENMLELIPLKGYESDRSWCRAKLVTGVTALSPSPEERMCNVVCGVTSLINRWPLQAGTQRTVSGFMTRRNMDLKQIDVKNRERIMPPKSIVTFVAKLNKQRAR